MTAPGTTGSGSDDPEAVARRARKAAIRRATRVARDGMTPTERAVASAAAVDRLGRLRELRRAGVVAGYAAHGSELDLGALLAALRERGTTVALPRVAGDEVVLVTAGALTPLAVGYRGIEEPTGPPIDLEAVDVVLVPGVAFDPSGGRVGQGGGHYDRLLARLPDAALRVGVGFACQLVPRVPREDHDEPVDLVVTDRATYRTDARS